MLNVSLSIYNICGLADTLRRIPKEIEATRDFFQSNQEFIDKVISGLENTKTECVVRISLESVSIILNIGLIVLLYFLQVIRKVKVKTILIVIATVILLYTLLLSFYYFANAIKILHQVVSQKIGHEQTEKTIQSLLRITISIVFNLGLLFAVYFRSFYHKAKQLAN